MNKSLVQKFCEKNFFEYTFLMGFKLSLILGVLLVASLAGSKYLFDQLSQAKANQVILESKITEQNDSIKQYLAKQEQLSADLGELEAQKQNALREVNKLRQTFAKHDLDNLALNKPGLIEKIVNKGSKKVMTDLVELTTVKEDETATN
jgi:cell division protein FtsB